MLIADDVGGFARQDFAAGDAPVDLALGDLDRDGALDVLVGGDIAVSGGRLRVLLGNGDGTFGAAALVDVPFALGLGLALADVDGDGILDVAALGISLSSVAILAGDGAGDFVQTAGSNTGSQPRAVVVGDFDRDGRPDLAVRNSGATTVSVIPNTSP